MPGLLLESSEFRDTLNRVKRGEAKIDLVGLSGSQKSFFIAGLLCHACRPVFVVTPNQQEAERLTDDLETFLGPGRAYVFPPMDVLPYEETAMSADLAASRARALSALAAGAPCAVVAPARALGRRMIPPEVYAKSIFVLRKGDTRDLQDLAGSLSALGYDHLGKVEGRGQASVRGGIIDIFPFDAAKPSRVEFYGDEIESIRLFDVETQRSSEDTGQVIVSPAREFLYDHERLERGMRAISEELSRIPAGEQLRERVANHLARLEAGSWFDNEEQYLPFFYQEVATIVDWAPGALLVVDEPTRIREALAGYEADIRETYAGLLEAGMLLPSGVQLYLEAEQVLDILNRRQLVTMSLLSRSSESVGGSKAVAAPIRQAEIYAGRPEDLAHEIRNFRKRRYRVVCVVSTDDRRDRLAEFFEDKGIPAVKMPSLGFVPEEGAVSVIAGEMESGFQYPDIRLLLLTDAEIYGKQKKRRRWESNEEGARIGSYTDLVPGDYVVHVAHGVGRYAGVRTLEAAGVQRDYLLVQYAGEDKVYVPTDQVVLLQKYIGMEDATPKLNKLGGAEWTRAKNKARESVNDIAKDLIALYAERESVRGYAFSSDTVWQHEFEDAFAYEETPDQWRAIVDVKRDMEKPAPMDRLLCGDVGFGKTEVALRAAFKAAADGKQVAILVPTTILAQQHYNTFTERFRGFPMKVAMMSRFQSEQEQKETLRGIRMGSVDVVIGTHRLLSQDVRFHNLGLVVVDEEQRFGVAQKERFKELRKEVDVLTLTATPIPRTLHMAMAGVRDMSLIGTPPENRFPIRTYVVEYNEALVREVILREIDRGGQVYYVHNRVQSIEEIAARLGRLVPEASIGIAHGQMTEDRLERIMLQFLEREFNVLVCTTIIESGIDIPNVNTIVINDSENLGLAQLYQLRGRVGRTNRVAYAYLLFRRDRVLTEVAEKRLAAIKEFTSLGSGYKIAMRDLEIRGAGNLLGAEQHGHIAAVGFEMYCRMLEEAVKELKGEPKREEPPQILIDLPVDAFVPDGYVPDSRQKIEVYKKVNGIESPEDASDLHKEFQDRFGALPAPVENLLSIAAMKVLARELGASAVSGERNAVVIRFTHGVRYGSQDMMRITRQFKGRVTMALGRSQTIRVRTTGLSERGILSTLLDLLTEMKQGIAVNQ
ncbi:MAG: transcription-repair coupling factor [Clostridia bacterium]|nr:transcription-repair coupling factor [Clostridia bacterium]